MSTEKLFEFIDDHVGLQLASVALLSLAVIPIYAGSYASLAAIKRPVYWKPKRRSASVLASPFEDSDDEGEEKAQVLSIKDILMIPVVASVVLYSLHLALQEVSPDCLHKVIQVVTSVFSCAVFSNTAVLVAKRLLPDSCLSSFEKYKLTFSKRGKRLCYLNVTVIHALVLAVSVVMAVIYAATQHWLIGNLFAISIAINSVAFLAVDSFFTGFLLLLGMLAYDVFWLFGTDIMQKVSDALESAPTSIVWPRNINTYLFDKLLKADQYFTMFGLGDIIVPGIFIAYCLRFDRLHSWKKAKKGSDFTLGDFSKPYFTASLIAYALSAGASIYMVHFTKKAQSALLYIVPALILSTLGTALVRNELSSVLSCSDVVKTFQKLSTFSTDNDDDEEEEDEERPTRYRRASLRGRSTSAARGGRSVSKGRSRSKLAEAKEIPSTSEHEDDCNFEAKLDRTIEDDVIEEHATGKPRRKRAASKVTKKK
ncbi:signal peptide peptidase-domain-containing protein [Helicostylum pulchrum]|nr:signal peptide peptidase-domain-containing protein [Helicostylum pulchrum]